MGLCAGGRYVAVRHHENQSQKGSVHELAAQMLRLSAFPAGVNHEELAACIEACVACVQVCTACADA